MVKVLGQALISNSNSTAFHSGIFTESIPSGTGGNAGSITFMAGALTLQGGGTITSSTYGLAPAGRVDVQISGQALIQGGGIFSDSNSTGAGGRG